MFSTIEVDAESMEQAINLVEDSDDLPEGIYLDNSFLVNEEITRQINLKLLS